MKILVMPNLEKNNIIENTIKIIKKLHSLNCDVLMCEKHKALFEFDFISFENSFEEQLKKCDIVIAVGGDGTIIHYAKHAAVYKKPVLGINLGRMGYMADLEAEELDLLSALIDGKYEIEHRMMLKVNIKKRDDEEYFALNDMVVSRGSLSRIVDLYVRHGDSNSMHYRADGIIVSTPTGSTAYSLSAGGPIVDPNVKSIILTPICPHSFFARSVIFEEKAVLEIFASEREKNEIYLTVDGDDTVRLNENDVAVIQKCEYDALFVRVKHKNFADVLNEKFMEKDVK